MTTLSIGRLTATLPEPPDEGALAARVEGMLAGATGRRLDEALGARPLPAGHWFLRRLAVRLPLDPHRASPGTERQWADAIAVALHDAVVSGQAVHYDSECDALADLMASAAVGRLGNEWAWQEFGLVDAGVSGQPGRAVLAAFGRHPEFALAAASSAVARSGADAVHRLLGPSGWLELARLVYRAHTDRPPPAWLAAAGGHGAAGGRPAGPPPDRAVAARISRLAGGELAWRFRQARIRPGPGTAIAWAVLAAAAGDPGLLMLSAAEPALTHLAAALLPGGIPPAEPAGRGGSRAAAAPAGPVASPAGPGRATATDAGAGQAASEAAGSARASATEAAGPGRAAGDAAVPGRAVSKAAGPDWAAAKAAGPGQPAGGAAGAGRAAADGGGTAAGAAPAEPGSATAGHAHSGPAGRSPAGDDPVREPGHVEDRLGWPSSWAGVLHLYRSAAGADVPAALLADDALAARPLAWVLHAIACQLVPGAPDDSALLAFAGLLPTDEPPSRAGRPADDPELDSVAGHARRWLAVTAQRLLDDPAATVETVERLLHRRGTIFAERGWIDVEMPLSTVDIDIRRVGLDIDPGWIGWLGTVVKFRYV